MDEMLKKQDVLDAIYEKMEKTDKPDVILGLAAAMSTVKQMQVAPVTPAEKQEPCEDCISRKDLGLTDFEIVMCDGNYKEALMMLLDKIEKALPVKPAEKVGHWIPVSERLPEFTINKFAVRTHFTEDVLVYDGTDLRVGYFARKDKLDRDYWVVYGDDYFEPIAWMPLPEPYKDGEQNE